MYVMYVCMYDGAPTRGRGNERERERERNKKQVFFLSPQASGEGKPKL